MSQLQLVELKETLIDPLLFAHNLEHTRSCMYQGLSAQKIRNRKFAGKPACRIGVADEWYKIGKKEIYLTLDRFDSYVTHVKMPKERRNECNSQLIQNPYAGQEAGIGQADIYLNSGEEYEVKAVLKCRGEGEKICEIRLTDYTGKKIYFSHKRHFNENVWEDIRFSFTAEETTEKAHLQIVFSFQGEVKVGVVSLLPVNNFYGMRIDVVELLKEIGVTALRWPGGNFAGEYRWRDGLLDCDKRGALLSFRSIETQPHSHGFDFHEIGVDEFIELCREIGAEPYITINLAWDSPEECGEFVQYCNGDLSTKGGKLRSERGHKEPYNVKYWSLGNEFGLGHMEGPNTPEEYTAKALLCARAMKEADPEIILFASGAYSPEHDMEPWFQKSLPLLAPEIDYISYHNYQPRIFEDGMDFTTLGGMRKNWNEVCQAPNKCFQNLSYVREKLDAGTDAMKKIKIAFDEWNLYFAWYHDPCTLEGIYTALMLEMFCKKQQELNMSIAMYFQPVNEGAINVYQENASLTSNGQVFRLMKKHQGNKLWQVDINNEKLHCLASENETEFICTMINISYDEDIEITFPEMKKVTAGKCISLIGQEVLQGSLFSEGIKNWNGEPLVVPRRSILQIEMSK